MASSLAGRVVLITGAARGIGAETARIAARRGAAVSLVGLEPERLQALAEELGPGHGWFECDVTDQSAVDRAVAGTVAALGGIDAVVANAGISNNGTVAANPVSALTRTVDVNVNGVIRTVSAALPHVTERKGYILIVSSAAALSAFPGIAAYSASKIAVEHFGGSLRMELAHKGVQVGVAHPSWIDTDLVRDQQIEIGAFELMLQKMPWPYNTVLPVETCATALVDAIEQRRRKIYVPEFLAVVEVLRPFFMGPLWEAIVNLEARHAIPKFEAELEVMGRAFGMSSTGMGGKRD
ncbi:MAG: SDR family oxidoreductase [Candidatus Sericytochromatia bacterium]